MMLAKMADAIRTGYWQAAADLSPMIINQLAQNIIENGVSCCDCVCGNVALMTWATSNVNPTLLAQLQSAMYQATQRQEFKPSEQEPEPQTQPQTPSETSSQPVGTTQTGQPDAAGEEATTDTSDENGEGADSEVGMKLVNTPKNLRSFQKHTIWSAQSGLPIAAVAELMSWYFWWLGYLKET